MDKSRRELLKRMPCAEFITRGEKEKKKGKVKVKKGQKSINSRKFNAQLKEVK